VAEAFRFALDAIHADHTKLLGGVRSGVESAGKKDPWVVSGLGWKNVASQLVEGKIKELNNAGPGQVVGLVHYALGIPDILAAVSWQSMNSGKVISELGTLINDVRGDIVHTGKTNVPLGKSTVERWQNFVSQLVKYFDRALAKEVEARYGLSPWTY
jgi:hypothetical protein